MKNKHINLAILLLCTVFLISCSEDYKTENISEESNINDIYITTTPNISNEVVKDEPTEENVDIIEYYPLPSVDKYRNAEGSLINDVKMIEKSDYYTYINEWQGYSIDIPICYKDYILIREYEEHGKVRFSFYGKSAIGRGWFYFMEPTTGLYLFTILSEESLKQSEGIFDIYGKIGTIDGVDYYVITATDVPVGSLSTASREIENGDSYFQDDEEEMQLIIGDRIIADKINKDIRIILETFTVLD